MDTQHTPGPWLFVTDGKNPIVQRGGSGGFVVTDTVVKRAEADARLIAAAPELLEALISLEQAYANRHSPQHRASCLIEARSVIAKAKGENK